MPDTNPLGELVRALEDETSQSGHCRNCGLLVEECSGDAIGKGRLACWAGRLRVPLAAFKAWRPEADEEAAGVAARALWSDFHGPSSEFTRDHWLAERYRKPARAAIKALWEHLGLTP